MRAQDGGQGEEEGEGLDEGVVEIRPLGHSHAQGEATGYQVGTAASQEGLAGTECDTRDRQKPSAKSEVGRRTLAVKIRGARLRVDGTDGVGTGENCRSRTQIRSDSPWCK